MPLKPLQAGKDGIVVLAFAIEGGRDTKKLGTKSAPRRKIKPIRCLFDRTIDNSTYYSILL